MTGHGIRARSAAAWNMGINVFRQLLQFTTMLILVRLLPPASYGEFSLTTSLITFLTWISFSNFISHTIQVNTEEDTHYQDHFTAGGVLQFSVFLLANAIAFGTCFSSTYAKVAPFIHVMSFGLLFGWPGEFHRMRLARRFEWRRLGLLNGIGFISGAVIGPLLAWSGAGTYALLLPGLLLHLPFIFDLFFVEKWRPTWAWSWAAYRPAFKFGITRITSGAVVGGRLILESSILGLLLGLTGLGFFTRAVGLAQMFCSTFASELLAAIYPVLTRIDDTSENTRRIGGLVLRLVFWISLPIAITLGSLAPQVVRMVYGNQWVAVGPLLPLSLAVAVVYAMNLAANSLLLARQQPFRCLAMDLLLLLGTTCALIVAYFGGIRGYLSALMIGQAVVFAIALLWLIQFSAVSLVGIRDVFAPALMAGGCAWGITHLVMPDIMKTIDKKIWYVIFDIIAWSSLFGVLYFAILRFMFRDLLKNLIQHFPFKEKILKFIFISE